MKVYEVPMIAQIDTRRRCTLMVHAESPEAAEELALKGHFKRFAWGAIISEETLKLRLEGARPPVFLTEFNNDSTGDTHE